MSAERGDEEVIQFPIFWLALLSLKRNYENAINGVRLWLIEGEVDILMEIVSVLR